MPTAFYEYPDGSIERRTIPATPTVVDFAKIDADLAAERDARETQQVERDRQSRLAKLAHARAAILARVDRLIKERLIATLAERGDIDDAFAHFKATQPRAFALHLLEILDAATDAADRTIPSGLDGTPLYGRALLDSVASELRLVNTGIANSEVR